ncbi:MAG: hypothetical protein IT440_11215, partial [Phycisphaeraceae bacterium]|nr:hypothetical protein [Phycisphaeraceae bacterium]
MLKFQIFEDGKPAKKMTIRNAYLIGSDGNPMRGDLFFDKGMLWANKRETGVAAVAIQQPVGELGELTLQTCLLPDREEPYILSLELARHRLMSLYNKSEDWGMFDIKADQAVSKRMEVARNRFIEALCHQGDNPIKCDLIAREALVAAVDGSEELAIAHADLLLGRRRSTGSLPRHVIGCGVPLALPHPRLRDGIVSHFDFISLPMPWKMIAP